MPSKIFYKQTDINAFARFGKVNDQHYGLLMGLNLQSSKSLSAGLNEIAENLAFPLAENADAQLDLNVDEHLGINFHRIIGPNAQNDSNLVKLFGENAGLYIGAGQKTIWVCLGGNSAMTELKSAIDSVAGKTAGDKPSSVAKMHVNLKPLMTLISSNRPERAQARIQPVMDLLTEENDQIKIVMFGEDEVLTAKATFASGLLKMLGYGNVSWSRFQRAKEPTA